MRRPSPASTGSRASPGSTGRGWPADLKQGAEITGVTLSNPEPVLSVRTK